MRLKTPRLGIISIVGVALLLAGCARAAPANSRPAMTTAPSADIQVSASTAQQSTVSDVVLAPYRAAPLDQPKLARETRTVPTVVRQSTSYKVVNISRKYHTYGKQEIARCDGSNGSSCIITKTRGATRTIGLTPGLSRGFIAGGLNITTASSESVSIGCSHTVTPKQWYIAYPVGTTYRYRVQKVVSTFTGISTSKHTTYSGYLTAFSPSSASIRCVLKAK